MKQALLWMFVCLTSVWRVIGTNRTGATHRDP